MTLLQFGGGGYKSLYTPLVYAREPRSGSNIVAVIISCLKLTKSNYIVNWKGKQYTCMKL